MSAHGCTAMLMQYDSGYQYQYCVNSARPMTAVRLQSQERWEEQRVPGQALTDSFTLVSSHKRAGGEVDATAANLIQK